MENFRKITLNIGLTDKHGVQLPYHIFYAKAAKLFITEMLSTRDYSYRFIHSPKGESTLVVQFNSAADFYHVSKTVNELANMMRQDCIAVHIESISGMLCDLIYSDYPLKNWGKFNLKYFKFIDSEI